MKWTPFVPNSGSISSIIANVSQIYTKKQGKQLLLLAFVDSAGRNISFPN